MKKPLIITNLKAYAESTGAGALRIARACKKLSQSSPATFALCPQSVDIRAVNALAGLQVPLFAQHIDDIDPGAHTGHMSISAHRDAGCVGSLINHSEHRIPFSDIKARVSRCRQDGFLSIVCVQDVAEAKKMAALHPDLIAFEPPELIGGKISVATAKPDLIKKTVLAVHALSPKTQVLCGAGVHAAEDVRIALKLGCIGVLLASAVATSKTPERVLQELAKGCLQ